MSSLGFSVYVSSFDSQNELIKRSQKTDSPIFLSLHISEEFDDDYIEKVERICKTLSEDGFRIIADVSTKTSERFGRNDLVSLAKELGIWALRIDYGFSDSEIKALAQKFPIVLNASTTSKSSAKSICDGAKNVMAMHNFYPRPETGLDDAFFTESTSKLSSVGLKVLAFVQGDKTLRAPVFEGLPTLERHRFQPPSVSFIDLAVNFGIEDIFVGDPDMTIREYDRIMRFCRDDVIEIPTVLDDEYKYLYDQIFTCRTDSPASLVRFAESRIYSCYSDRSRQKPQSCHIRNRGAITMDNEHYGRYAGEIQMMRSDFAADKRINVIGQIKPQFLDMSDNIKNGAKFVLTRD